jgi:hypothetical protein
LFVDRSYPCLIRVIRGSDSRAQPKKVAGKLGQKDDCSVSCPSRLSWCQVRKPGVLLALPRFIPNRTGIPRNRSFPPQIELQSVLVTCGSALRPPASDLRPPTSSLLPARTPFPWVTGGLFSFVSARLFYGLRRPLQTGADASGRASACQELLGKDSPIAPVYQFIGSGLGELAELSAGRGQSYRGQSYRGRSSVLLPRSG